MTNNDDQPKGPGFRTMMIFGAVLALIATILVPFLFMALQLTTLIYVETPEEAAQAIVSRYKPDVDPERLVWRKKRVSKNVVELTGRMPGEMRFHVRVRHVWGLGWEEMKYEYQDLK